MKNFSYILTTNSISIDYEDNYFVINKSDLKKYNTVKDYIKTGNYDKIIEFLVPAKRIMIYANEFFSVDSNGNLFMTDKPSEPVPTVISTKLLDFIGEDLPIDPLVKFWKKLRENPSEESKKDLYLFLEKNNHPLTPEGNFIAYKKVTRITSGKLVDSHTKRISNDIGSTPSMKRSDVDADRNRTCSSGLHVAAMSYAKNFSGDVLVKVLVDPSDVVAVPTDYNNEKMRVCKYKVLSIINDTDKAFKNKEILDKIPKSKDLNKVTLDTKLTGTSAKDVVNYFSATDNTPIKVGSTVVLSGFTARELVEKTHKDLRIKIKTPLKNKKTILSKAIKYYQQKGFNVKL